MIDRNHLQSITVGVATLFVAIIVAGCTTQQTTVSSRTFAANRSDSPESLERINRPAGMSQTSAVRAGLLTLGTVPFDNMTLPLVSPDGRYIATQTGVAPTWPTIMAEQQAEIPVTTRLEIYELDWRAEITPEERNAPSVVASITQPVILGRSCDSEGFLVEAPQEDGSRWIGKATWSSGEIDWLVSDDNVNAFAALGPDGVLAWSRRAINDSMFHLVVRTADKEWTTGQADEDWLLPTWGGRGDGLFVLQLTDGRLDALYGYASSQLAFHQSLQTHGLATDSSRFDAYQCLSSQTGTTVTSQIYQEQLLYFHPALGRMAIWRPLAPSGKKALHLNAKSIGAISGSGSYVLVSTENNLLRQHLERFEDTMPLIAGVQVPRAIHNSNWPFIVLSPGEARIGLAAMTLLPAN